MSTPYTSTEIAYIREHYSALGATRCGRALNRPAETIRRMAKQWGLQWCRVKPDEERNVNPSHFRTVTLPEVAYFLGYFWADGHIHSYTTGKAQITHHRIAIELAAADAKHLLEVASRFGRWSTVTRCRPRNGFNPMTALVVNNQPLYQFLFDHGYDTKSEGSPVKILAHIPEHLRPAFWLGYFDGDGCLSFTTEKGTPSLSFAGSYEQDWGALSQTLDTLGIAHSVYHRESRLGHRDSTLVVHTRQRIARFAEYVGPFMQLGLPRKREKFDRLRSESLGKVSVDPSAHLLEGGLMSETTVPEDLA